MDPGLIRIFVMYLATSLEWQVTVRVEHYHYDVRSYSILIPLATIIPVVLAIPS